MILPSFTNATSISLLQRTDFAEPANQSWPLYPCLTLVPVEMPHLVPQIIYNTGLVIVHLLDSEAYAQSPTDLKVVLSTVNWSIDALTSDYFNVKQI
jgi:hypothetical protein